MAEHEHGGLCTPMTPMKTGVGPTPSDGSFYGPNIPPSVGGHARTEGLFPIVQFGPNGFAAGPLDTPFTTATPIDSKGSGETSHGEGGLDTPMKSRMNQNTGY